MSAVLPQYSLPPKYSTLSLLDRCAAMPELRQIHAHMIKTDLVSDATAVRRLISSLSETPNESVAIYSRILCCSDTLRGVEFSLPSVLRACGRSSALQEGRQVHAQVLKAQFQDDPFIANSVLRMYLELGEIEIAAQLFDRMPLRDIISWNSMISGCVKAGDIELALNLFDEMPHRDLVSWNSMIYGLMKCGRCRDASRLFYEMEEHDVITWTSMISGFVLNSRPKEALEFFRRMLGTGIRPDAAAIVNALSAIADLGFADEGRWVHAYILRVEVELISGVLGSALVDMYSKCGLIANAYRVFRSICYKRRLGDWNSMISGFALHGLGLEALDIFHEMEMLGILPDEITMLGILSACSHGGLVEEGKFYFEFMHEKYKLKPKLQHFGCLIDLLGRAGLIEEAQRVIIEMTIEPDAMAWKSMLSACVKHSHISIGEHAAMRAIELAPHDSSCYVLLSNIYAKFGRYGDVENVRRLMRERGIRKIPGCSMVMINGRAHEFLVGKVMGMGCMEKVLAKLNEVMCRLKLEGYEPDLTQVLVDIEEEEKEGLLSVHSEKMAIALGLLNLRKGVPIHIVKNLKMCGDCHAFSKLVSRVYCCDIIMRDQNRFHHFREGSCSCHEYW